MRAVIGAAVRTGTFPGLEGHGPAGPAPGTTAAGTGLAADASAANLPVAPGVGPAIAPPRERFRAALEKLAGVVHEARTAADAAAIVARIAAERQARTLLAWSDEAIGVPGLFEALASHGLDTVDPELPQQGPNRPPALERLASLTIGLTGADYALADTGSLVLVSGPGRPRLASLLTPVHIAILRPHRFLDSIETLFNEHPELVGRGSNLVCITGPSRTADIEHTLSRGVHGPGDVHAILMGD
jgi:L-lactate dehydrogenase complex protein LldG